MSSTGLDPVHSFQSPIASTITVRVLFPANVLLRTVIFFYWLFAPHILYRKWFVVANGIAFSYALLTLLFSAFFHTPKIARFVLILDLLVAFMIMSGASAGTAIAYLGKNGLSQAAWNPLCGTFHRYCGHVLGALVASYLGWVYLTIVIIVGLHRRY